MSHNATAAATTLWQTTVLSNSTTATPPAADETLNLVLAVVLSVGSACTNSLGLVMQKWAKKPCSPWWIFGNLVFQSGSLLMGAALVFGDQLLVGPLGSLVMVFNIPFSRCFLKERASVADIIGSIFIMAGVACVAVFGPVSDHKPKPAELDDLLFRPVFVGVAGSLIVYMVVVWIVAHFMSKKMLTEREVVAAFAALQEPLATDDEFDEYLFDGRGDDDAQMDDVAARKKQLSSNVKTHAGTCLLYTSPSPRDRG